MGGVFFTLVGQRAKAASIRPFGSLSRQAVADCHFLLLLMFTQEQRSKQPITERERRPLRRSIKRCAACHRFNLLEPNRGSTRLL